MATIFNISHIAYLKSDAKYTALYVDGKPLVRLRYFQLGRTSDPHRFVRIHRSVIVNLDYVESMKTDEQSQLQLQMRDGSVLVANRESSPNAETWRFNFAISAIISLVFRFHRHDRYFSSHCYPIAFHLKQLCLGLGLVLISAFASPTNSPNTNADTNHRDIKKATFYKNPIAS